MSWQYTILAVLLENLFYYTSTSQTDRLSRLWSPMNFIFCKPIQLPVQTRCYRSIRAAAELIFEMKNRQHKSSRMKSNYSKFVVKHQRCQCEERVNERVGNSTQKKMNENYRETLRVSSEVEWIESESSSIVVPARRTAWASIARFIARILVSCFHVVNSNNIKTAQLCHLSHEIYGDAFVSFLHFQLARAVQRERESFGTRQRRCIQGWQ